MIFHTSLSQNWLLCLRLYPFRFVSQFCSGRVDVSFEVNFNKRSWISRNPFLPLLSLSLVSIASQHWRANCVSLNVSKPGRGRIRRLGQGSGEQSRTLLPFHYYGVHWGFTGGCKREQTSSNMKTSSAMQIRLYPWLDHYASNLLQKITVSVHLATERLTLEILDQALS